MIRVGMSTSCLFPLRPEIAFGLAKRLGFIAEVNTRKAGSDAGRAEMIAETLAFARRALSPHDVPVDRSPAR